MILNWYRIFTLLVMFVSAVLACADDAKEVVIASVEELKSVMAREITWEKDGAKMVRIPAGSFQMGSNDGNDNEKPVHIVYVDAFYMDKYEVTNAQYQQFVHVTRHLEPHYWSNSGYNQPNQPVVGVTWHNAEAYAKWAGKRLPTEAEWEYAACGGLSSKKYPLGDLIGSSQACYANNKPNSVGSYSANGYGLYDMAGNVWEWCSYWYDSDYYGDSPSRNPQGLGD